METIKTVSGYTDETTKEILKIQAQRCADAAKIAIARNYVRTDSSIAIDIINAILACGEFDHE